MQVTAPPTISPLARLLAQEDITVMVDGSAKTASFDTVHRVLRLPEWRNMSPAQYSMLVGHECAHALWTDSAKWMAFCERWRRDPYAIGVLNIIEDARIERLMKSKYPGLRKDFARAYREFHAAGMFAGVKGDELIDRINLYYKVGFITPITFAADERVWLDRIDAAVTIDDAIQIAEDFLADYEPVAPPEGEGEGEGEGQGRDGEGEDGERVQGRSKPRTAGDDGKIREGDNHGGEYKRTASHSYIIPHLHLDQVVLPWERMSAAIIKSNASIGSSIDTVAAMIADAEGDMRSNVSFMANRFNQRKAADEHQRTDTSRSGALDPNRLVWYKTEDDIFRTVETRRDGKNHGFVMLLDWSGSMGGNRMNGAFWQMYEFCLFLRRVGVPYRVYAFSSYPVIERVKRIENGDNRTVSKTDDKLYRDPAQIARYASMGIKPIVHSSDPCCLLELMSSTMTITEQRRAAAVYATACCAIHAIGDKHTSGNVRTSINELYSLSYDLGISLSGTPLVSALAMMPQVIDQFRDDHPHQITNFVLLSDGEGGAVFSSGHYSRDSFGLTPTIKDQRTGFTFTAEPGWPDDHGYATLVGVVRHLTQAICSCFFVDWTIKYGLNAFGVTQDAVSKLDPTEVRKVGGAVLPSTVWDEFFFLKAGNEQAAKNEEDPKSLKDVRTQMSKEARKAIKSRYILGRFIDRISGSAPRPKRNKASAAA